MKLQEYGSVHTPTQACAHTLPRKITLHEIRNGYRNAVLYLINKAKDFQPQISVKTEGTFKAPS
jgi:hypothetical protein